MEPSKQTRGLIEIDDNVASSGISCRFGAAALDTNRSSTAAAARRHHVLSASPLPRAVRERARYTWTSAAGRSERARRGRASGWAHSRARSHTRPCAALESTRDDDDDGDRGRRSSRCRSGAESVCEVLSDRVRRVIIGDRPQFLSVIPTSCAATRATTDRPSRSRCPAAASQC